MLEAYFGVRSKCILCNFQKLSKIISKKCQLKLF